MLRMGEAFSWSRAGVPELVDGTALGAVAAKRGGSSPFTRTIFQF